MKNKIENFFVSLGDWYDEAHPITQKVMGAAAIIAFWVGFVGAFYLLAFLAVNYTKITLIYAPIVGLILLALNEMRHRGFRLSFQIKKDK